MHRYLYTFLCLIFLIQNLPAQEDSSHLTHGKSLLFSFQGLNLGGGLGGKYWLNDCYALRTIVSASYQDAQSNNLLVTPYESNYDSKLYGVSLSIGLEKHFAVTRNFSPYVGVNGSVSWNERADNYLYTDSTTQRVISSRGFGGTIALGAEYWILPWISLAGEESFGVSYSTSSGFIAGSSFSASNSTSSLMLLIYL